MKARLFTRRAFAGFLALAIVVPAAGLVGCGSSTQASDSSSTEDKTITVAASPTPHAEILAQVKDKLAEQGYTLEVKEFSDYVLPNTATEEGEVDANYFQHQPYLDSFNEENDTHLVSVATLHFEPFQLFSNKYDAISELPDGATVAVPNDTTNEARALLLLEQEGLIEVDDEAGITATPKDITSNPKNLKFKELESATVPTVLDDVDLAAINGNYALSAGLSSEDAIAAESDSSLAAQTYGNVLVVKEGNENTEKTQALVAALQSDEVRDYINNTYQGAVVPLF